MTITETAAAVRTMPTKYPVKLTLECQTCGQRHTDTWPNLRRCPACAAKRPGPPRRLSEDACGNGRYEALPGDAQTILSGRVTDAMIFEQVAFARSLGPEATA